MPKLPSGILEDSTEAEGQPHSLLLLSVSHTKVHRGKGPCLLSILTALGVQEAPQAWEHPDSGLMCAGLVCLGAGPQAKACPARYSQLRQWRDGALPQACGCPGSLAPSAPTMQNKANSS